MVGSLHRRLRIIMDYKITDLIGSLLVSTNFYQKLDPRLIGVSSSFTLPSCFFLLSVFLSSVFLIPTLLMYICYVLALILFLFVLETRVDILACAILIGNFPVRCPKKWEPRAASTLPHAWGGSPSMCVLLLRAQAPDYRTVYPAS